MDDKVKIFGYNDDETLRKLGEILANDTARKIMHALTAEGMYVNKIAEKLNMRPSLVFYHLQKMEEIGLTQITNRTIKKKGMEHKFYQINSGFFISPGESTDEIKERGSIKKIFKKNIKIIGASLCFIGWQLFQNMQTTESSRIIPGGPSNEVLGIVVPLIMTGAFLLVLKVLKKRKK